MAKSGRINREIAEKIAIHALAFLASDPEKLERFLSLTGVDPGMIRTAAADPGFLAGVLDHVASDEPLLLATAEHAGVSPATLSHAQVVLGGQWEREVP